jgi:DNA-binding transcriptional regulator YdaS (Cro superfamily)
MTSPLTNYLSEERGRVTALADRLGINRVTLYRWGKTAVPAERVVQLERLTGIPRHRLRPDIFEAARGSRA